ncbi:hypothetical protein C2857_003020 [Epichloe festucae Fl1]|uniref:Uncharacterized protein n=1 Tax=Epichloe festucae (strain Fl1) TaxID=877507 RepID=A0A7U3Q1E2_EPIFF|nr:hypothetical protein C2857_003020 [Epichloe festucae Fl1]
MGESPLCHRKNSRTPSPRGRNRMAAVADPAPDPKSVAAKVYGKILRFVSDIGLREHDIPPWSPACQMEKRALDVLQNYLSSLAYQSSTGTGNGQGHNSGTESGQDHSSSHTIPTASSSSINSFAQARSPGSDDRNTRMSRFREDLEMGELSSSTLHLLSCVERGRYAVDFRPELVTNISDDQHLFRTLRKSYYEIRGRLRPYWSLRTIQSIQFMKVRENFCLPMVIVDIL